MARNRNCQPPVEIPNQSGAPPIQHGPEITRIIGCIPYRLALAGGWIDQPFVSKLNPDPSGSMVVVSLEPTFRFMDRSGISTSTREIATRIWRGKLPKRDPEKLVRELYAAENLGKAEPSGSQDMIGLIYPGISRLDYDYRLNMGIYPRHIESNNDPQIARWLERILQVIPVAPRPEGYNPLGERHFEPEWIRRLGQSGKDCYDAIVNRNCLALGRSFNECMRCWEALLPHTVRHPVLTVDLKALLKFYQAHYPGAMYSGCGGGYLFVVSEEPVPGALRVDIRTGNLSHEFTVKKAGKRPRKTHADLEREAREICQRDTPRVNFTEALRQLKGR